MNSAIGSIERFYEDGDLEDPEKCIYVEYGSACKASLDDATGYLLMAGKLTMCI